jgi:hypothetical protein
MLVMQRASKRPINTTAKKSDLISVNLIPSKEEEGHEEEDNDDDEVKDKTYVPESEDSSSDVIYVPPSKTKEYEILAIIVTMSDAGIFRGAPCPVNIRIKPRKPTGWPDVGSTSSVWGKLDVNGWIYDRHDEPLKVHQGDDGETLYQVQECSNRVYFLDSIF